MNSRPGGYNITPGDPTLPPGDAVWDSAAPTVTPSPDGGYYEVAGLPSWCGSDDPAYLAAYARAGDKADSRASARAVLRHLLSEMPAWRRLIWHMRLSVVLTPEYKNQ